MTIKACATWRRWLLALLLPALPTAESHGAGWRVAQVESQMSHGVRHVTALIGRENGATCEVHAAVFDARSHDIRVVDDPDGTSGGLAAVARKMGWIAGVNGGYFHPNQRPLGLVVSNGRVVHQQESARLLSGILAANNQQIFLLRPPEFLLGPRTRQALQAGPFLVDNATQVPGLEASRVARRTFVATDGGRQWALGTLGPLTLADAGSLLADEAFATAAFPVRRALNLDGGSSSAFVFLPEKEPATHLRELTRVRNFLGVAPRQAVSP